MHFLGNVIAHLLALIFFVSLFPGTAMFTRCMRPPRYCPSLVAFSCAAPVMNILCDLTFLVRTRVVLLTQHI